MIRVETKNGEVECEFEGSALDIIADVTLIIICIIKKMTAFPANKEKAKAYLQTTMSSIYKAACKELEVDP